MQLSDYRYLQPVSCVSTRTALLPLPSRPRHPPPLQRVVPCRSRSSAPCDNGHASALHRPSHPRQQYSAKKSAVASIATSPARSRRRVALCNLGLAHCARHTPCEVSCCCLCASLALCASKGPRSVGSALEPCRALGVWGSGWLRALYVEGRYGGGGAPCVRKSRSSLCAG